MEKNICLFAKNEGWNREKKEGKTP